jgi:DNA repair exonuclease SbcCD ATPase subunit
MNDTLEIETPMTADEYRRLRAERQRQQRVLQLDEQIAEANARRDQACNRLGSAEQRLSELEAERAELVALAPKGAAP